jgi:membrane protein YqaA with SNARE-associated domain
MSEAIQTIADYLAVYGYPALFLLVFAENIGIPVPGETALLAGGFLCSAAGGERLRLDVVMPLAFVAAVMGDNIGYWLGRRFARPRLAHGQGFWFLTPARMAWAESYFERFGPITVAVARFITGLRVIAGPAAGAAGMAWGTIRGSQRGRGGRLGGGVQPRGVLGRTPLGPPQSAPRPGGVGRRRRAPRPRRGVALGRLAPGSAPQGRSARRPKRRRRPRTVSAAVVAVDGREGQM